MKICLIAYKIDPEKGSEDASGYHLVKEILRAYPKATLITRKNNCDKLKNDPDFKGVNLIGVDVPKILSFYKKKNRGIILYYYLWQIFVGRVVKSLQKQQKFDIIHQLNFHTDWAPHFIRSDNAKVIWGPIAHHPSVPYSWFPVGFKYLYFKELVTRLAKILFWYLNPSLKTAIKHSDRILFANRDIPETYQKYGQHVISQLYAGSHWDIRSTQLHDKTFNIIYVGRLIPLKGPHLVCDVYDYFLKHISIGTIKPKLRVIGIGPLENLIKDRVKQINRLHPDIAEFSPWLERNALLDHYQKSDFMLYPSLEAQGLVVSEALSQNCAVITLADTGPAFITQQDELTIAVNSDNYAQTVTALGQKLIQLYKMQMDQPKQYIEIFEEISKRAHDLQWPAIANDIMKNYTT